MLNYVGFDSEYIYDNINNASFSNFTMVSWWRWWWWSIGDSDPISDPCKFSLFCTALKITVIVIVSLQLKSWSQLTKLNQLNTTHATKHNSCNLLEFIHKVHSRFIDTLVQIWFWLIIYQGGCGSLELWSRAIPGWTTNPVINHLS